MGAGATLDVLGAQQAFHTDQATVGQTVNGLKWSCTNLNGGAGADKPGRGGQGIALMVFGVWRSRVGRLAASGLAVSYAYGDDVAISGMMALNAVCKASVMPGQAGKA